MPEPEGPKGGSRGATAFYLSPTAFKIQRGLHML